MNKFWQSVISPLRKKYIKSANGFMELAKSYRADRMVLAQVRDFIRADMGPEVKGGFVNLIIQVEDNVFHIKHKEIRPTKYFEVLVLFKIVIFAENFRTGEFEKDLNIIFEKTEEVSKRQYKKLLIHFKTESPAKKTMRLIKTYPFFYKNKLVTK